MAKKASKPRAPRKEAAPGTVRRITHKTIMDGIEGGGDYKVYGIAKKVVIQNTIYGKIPGLKGSFEAVRPNGEKLVSKRCFLPVELHGDVAAKMQDGEEVAFGAHVTADKDDNVQSEFFAEPAQTDPMANLREQAGN